MNPKKRRSASRSGGLSEPEFHKRSYANAANGTLIPRVSMHLATPAMAAAGGLGACRPARPAAALPRLPSRRSSRQRRRRGGLVPSSAKSARGARSRAASTRPSRAATCKGVFPDPASGARAGGQHLAAEAGVRSEARPWVGRWAALAHSRAACKGVAPSARAALGSAPKSAMRSTASGAHPLAHAACKGVPPPSRDAMNEGSWRSLGGGLSALHYGKYFARIGWEAEPRDGSASDGSASDGSPSDHKGSAKVEPIMETKVLVVEPSILNERKEQKED